MATASPSLTPSDFVAPSGIAARWAAIAALSSVSALGWRPSRTLPAATAAAGPFRIRRSFVEDLPDRFEDTSIELEGHALNVVDIGQGDTQDSTILHVPSIAAVVGGDVVYNQVHMMTAETDERTRADWIARHAGNGISNFSNVATVVGSSACVDETPSRSSPSGVRTSSCHP